MLLGAARLVVLIPIPLLVQIGVQALTLLLTLTGVEESEPLTEELDGTDPSRDQLMTAGVRTDTPTRVTDLQVEDINHGIQARRTQRSVNDRTVRACGRLGSASQLWRTGCPQRSTPIRGVARLAPGELTSRRL